MCRLLHSPITKEEKNKLDNLKRQTIAQSNRLAAKLAGF